MAWTTIKTWLPQENITAAELNMYMRDNMAATLAGGSIPADGGWSVVTGPNAVAIQEPERADKNTSASTTSLTPVSVGPTMSSTSHNGQFLILLHATIRASSSSGSAWYAVSPNGDSLATTARAVRNQHTQYITCSAHVIHYNMPSPVTFDGYLWSDNGAVTAELMRASYTVFPL